MSSNLCDSPEALKRLREKQFAMFKKKSKSVNKEASPAKETSTRTNLGSSRNQIPQLQERLAHRIAVNGEPKQEEPIVRSISIPAGANYDDSFVNPIHHIRPGERTTNSTSSENTRDERNENPVESSPSTSRDVRPDNSPVSKEKEVLIIGEHVESSKNSLTSCVQSYLDACL
jgi:hypothetical protein